MNLKREENIENRRFFEKKFCETLKREIGLKIGAGSNFRGRTVIYPQPCRGGRHKVSNIFSKFQKVLKPFSQILKHKRNWQNSLNLNELKDLSTYLVSASKHAIYFLTKIRFRHDFFELDGPWWFISIKSIKSCFKPHISGER